MSMPIQQYFDLMVKAIDGDKAAATTVMPEAAERGRDFEAILAWVSKVGPINTSDSAEGPGSYNVEVAQFLQDQDLFTTAEGVEIAVEALKMDGSLWEWHDQLDIWARAPEELKKLTAAYGEGTDWGEVAENVGLFAGGLLTAGLIWGVNRAVKKRY